MKIGSMNLKNIEERIANGFTHGEWANLADGNLQRVFKNL